MDGANQTSKRRARRRALRCPALRGTGFTGISRTASACRSVATGYGAAIHRGQQRQAGRLPQIPRQSRVEISRYRHSSTQRTGGRWTDCANQNRNAPQPRSVVCADMAGAGLDFGNGNIKAQFFARRLRPSSPASKKSISPSAGLRVPVIGPSGGLGNGAARPSGGPILRTFPCLSRPSDGRYLEVPSPMESSTGN